MCHGPFNSTQLADGILPLPQPVQVDWGAEGVIHCSNKKGNSKKGSNCHNSVHVMVLFVSSHLLQELWVLSSMDLVLHSSFSWFRTSSWIKVLFSLEVDFDHCWKWDVPRLCLPMQGLQMISLVLREHSAWWIAVLAAHFRPEFVLIPASL